MTHEQAMLLVNDWRRLASLFDLEAKGHLLSHDDAIRHREEIAIARAETYRSCAHKLEQILKHNP